MVGECAMHTGGVDWPFHQTDSVSTPQTGVTLTS